MLKKKSTYVMAILGATGAVGKETLEILEERKFPLASLRLFASKRSAGGTMSCQGKDWTIEELTPDSSFAGVDFALISATDAISRDYGQKLGAAGVVVIDDSGVWRMEAAIPWNVFETKPTAGQHMGFAISISDDDTPGTTEQQSMVSNVGTRRLTDPTTWGDIQFTK